jgi:hypothetical protein
LIILALMLIFVGWISDNRLNTCVVWPAGVETRLEMSDVQNTLEVSQVSYVIYRFFIWNFFGWKFGWRLGKNRNYLDRCIEARYRSGIGIHMILGGDYICNLLWWIRLCRYREPEISPWEVSNVVEDQPWLYAWFCWKNRVKTLSNWTRVSLNRGLSCLQMCHSIYRISWGIEVD